MKNKPTISRRVALTGIAATAMLAPHVRRAGAADPIQLKLATNDTANDTSYLVAQRFAAEVKEKTGGKYEMALYTVGALGSGPNLANGLQTGIIDSAILTIGFLETISPSLQVLDMPFLFKDEKVAAKILDGDVGKRLLADMEPKNIIGLSFGWYGWRMMQIREKPVTKPNDLKGMKIRIQPAPVFAAMFKACGAIPVALDGGEVYLALSQKTVDAIEFPLPTAVTFKAYEVTKHLALTKHVYNAGTLMVSKALWTKMSQSDRDVFHGASDTVLPIWRSTIAQRADEAMTFLKEKGMQVTETDFPAFKAKMEPVYTEYRPKFPDLFDKIMAQQ